MAERTPYSVAASIAATNAGRAEGLELSLKTLIELAEEFGHAFPQMIDVFRKARADGWPMEDILVVAKSVAGEIEKLIEILQRSPVAGAFTAPTIGASPPLCRSRIAKPDPSKKMNRMAAGNIRTHYNFPPMGPGRSLGLAFLSLGGGIDGGDLELFCNRYSIPKPNVTFVSVDGANNRYTGDSDSADGENALDLDVQTGLTFGQLPIYMVAAPNSDTGFAHGIAKMRSLPIAAFSVSWGAEEVQWTAGGRAAVDAEFKLCVAMDLWGWIASGDSGSNGNNTDYPSSCPYAFGVGGTTYGPPESAWSYGGGGPSHYYDRPVWQTMALGPRRCVPDVAAIGDPNTGWDVVCGRTWKTFGGTSASAPAWAAAIATISSITGQRVKNLPGLLYSGKLGDITGGSNGAYRAQVGYDMCTGAGVPSKAFFDLALAVPPSPPVPVPVGDPVTGMILQHKSGAVESYAVTPKL